VAPFAEYKKENTLDVILKPLLALKTLVLITFPNHIKNYLSILAFLASIAAETLTPLIYRG
jgi:hypothetical protein